MAAMVNEILRNDPHNSEISRHKFSFILDPPGGRNCTI